MSEPPTTMDSYDPAQYGPMIDAILSVADLEKITVKRIRNALLELFAVDLLPHKKEMNDMILERYYKLLDERKNPKGPSKEEIERQDKLMAIQLLKEMLGPVTRRGGPSKVVKKKTTRKTTPNTAFNAEHVLSLQLQAVVGGARMSRPQVVKQMWVYIKEHGLQDPNDKRKVKCDEKLQALFKKLVVGMFEMNKLLGNHLYKDEDLVDGESVRLPSKRPNGTKPEKPTKKIKTEDLVKSEDDELESEVSDVDED